MDAIHRVAPIGIGTQLSVQDGFAVIQGLLPDAPAARSGQIREGDRIVAIAQGDSVFLDARNAPLQDIIAAIRGAPGTPVQLQVISADSPDSPPRTVTIVRDQIRHKQ
jgi:carboxyl-terminal processing protease